MFKWNAPEKIPVKDRFIVCRYEDRLDFVFGSEYFKRELTVAWAYADDVLWALDFADGLHEFDDVLSNEYDISTKIRIELFYQYDADGSYGYRLCQDGLTLEEQNRRKSLEDARRDAYAAIDTWKAETPDI